MSRTASKKPTHKPAATHAPSRTPPPKLRGKAAAADRHDLYERAVQCVEAEVDFVTETYRKLRKRPARVIREDFCGTFGVCCEWTKRQKDNVAIGLDIDPEPVAWGREHNLSKLSAAQQARVHILGANVLQPPRLPKLAPKGFDAVLAMNFSYWCFKERTTLLEYFRKARASLASDGLFFMDACGGADAMRICKEYRPIGRKGSRSFYTYIWDHADYDPITGDMLCKIHFKLPDGSRINDAFIYDWRHWSLPEIRDVLADAGFSSSTVYWEGDDSKGGGNGHFEPSTRGDCCDSFICYIVAEK